MYTAHHSVKDAGRAEPPIRYTLAGGCIGVTNVRSYLRTLVETAFWLGAAPLPARLLWRIGAHCASNRVQGWWALGVARALSLRIDWQGLEQIDRGEAYVITPLHEGFADALALLQLPLPLRFVVRDELAEWRLLGGYLRDTGQVSIRPEAGMSAYRQMVCGARRVLASGESLVVFPQGSILGIETDFHPGAFAIARTLQRPILPIALTGSHRVWEHPFGPRLRRGERMSVRVLPPIPVAEVRTGAIDELRRKVQCRLKAAALNRVMVPPRRFVPARDDYWEGCAYEIDRAFPILAADIADHRAGRAAGS
ncbi:MAG: lysophospholipid acyltransferase family protein [Thermomicrobiales bacterium]